MTRHVFAAVLCLAVWHRAAGQLSLSGWPRPSSSHRRGEHRATDAAPENGDVDAMDVFRLPGDVRPVSYALEVATDFARLTFAGRVDVTVRAVSRTCRITMNAKDVRVTGVRVTDVGSNQPLTVTDYRLVDRNEQLIVTLDDTKPCLIQSREYVVRVEFDAFLRDDMSGYYKSSYREDGEIKWLAVTQFEPTDARKAFPCFDEPSFKVPFKVSLMRRSDQISLSNMPLLNSTRIGKSNMFWDRFQETPPMSTYLVAFFVGEFYAMKTRNVGVYTHESYINQARYIASKSSGLLDAMENFTGVEYALPKLDLLAIPDFSAGAMENWGMNTYRERLLLLPENSRTKTKELVTTVVQHELSHQWFGDLVTCAWWDYLWLNEGFATFFEYFATKMVEPDWRLEDVFVLEVHQLALEYDQTPTHPISGSVKTPAEIGAMFDDISYSKAGAVIRMLQYAITEDNFREALKFYLINNAYAAATPEQLWIALENVLYDNEFDLGDNLTVTQFMRSWTEQTGYPLVTISKENNTFEITQERFLVTASNETTYSTPSNDWIIGLTYTTESRKNFTEVLPKTWLATNKTTVANQNDSGWYIFNLKSTGFYRVNYDEQNWNALIKQFLSDHTAIHVLNRGQVIDDLFNLALAEKVEYTLVLRLLQYLEKEDDVFPWYTAKYELGRLLNRMRRCSTGYKNLKLYVTHLAESFYAKIEDLVVNQNKMEHTIMISWNSFSNWACQLDCKGCSNTALSYFHMWREGKTIPADIKDAAFCVGVKYGDQNTWNDMLEVYVNSESATDRQAAQFALSCSTDLDQLAKYLDFMFDGSDGPIRPQDFRVIYRTLASTPHGITALIEFLTGKLDMIVNQIIDGNKVATSIYSILASRAALDDEISKIDELRYNQSVPEYLRKSFNSSFGAVDENLAWFKMHHPKIEKWSKTYVKDHGLDKRPIAQYNSSDVPAVSTEMTTEHIGHRSSGVSLNSQAVSFIILLTSFLDALRRFL